jgi:hypothetical protein
MKRRFKAKIIGGNTPSPTPSGDKIDPVFFIQKSDLHIDGKYTPNLPYEDIPLFLVQTDPNVYYLKID